MSGSTASSVDARRALPLLILAVAVLAHAHFYVAAGTEHTRWDSFQYLASAKSLMAGHGFRNEQGAIEARRTPGYPLLIAPLLRAGGIRAVVVAQHLLAAALAVAAYFVVRRLTGNVVAGAVAGLFLAVDSGQIYMADIVMTETAMSIVLFGAVALLLELVRSPSAARAAAAGFLISVGVLVRPVAMYLCIPLAVWIFVEGKRRRLLTAAAFTAAALALPLLWCWRNYEKAGTFSLSSIVGEDLYYWRAAGAVAMEKTGFTFVPLPYGGEEAFRTEFFRVTQRRFAAEERVARERTFGARAALLSEAQQSEFDGQLGRRILLAHPLGAVMVTVNGGLHLLFDSTWPYVDHLYSGWTRDTAILFLFASAVASVVLAMVGLWRLRRIDAPAAWLILIVLAYFVVVLSGPEHEQWRYRVPLVPIAAVAVGCSALPRRRPITTSAAAVSSDAASPT